LTRDGTGVLNWFERLGGLAGPPIQERWAPHDSLPFAFKAGTGHGKGGDAEFRLCHRSLARIASGWFDAP
jgi:hypothetical protein